MTRVEVSVQGVSVPMTCSTLALEDELGVAWSAAVEVIAAEPIETRPLLGRAAALRLEGERGGRVLDGLVAEVAAVATAQRSAARRYRLVLRSELHRLELAVRTRVFQHLSVPDVIGRVLERGGVAPDRLHRALQGTYGPRRYLVQSAERDAAFLRRLCEEEGLWLRAEGHGEEARFVLEDTSSAAPVADSSPLALVDAHGLDAARAVAFDPELRRQHRPGRVTCATTTRPPGPGARGARRSGGHRGAGVRDLPSAGPLHHAGRGRTARPLGAGAGAR
ncbi:MAG: contractile injection system protein, VgrG/Pvc8 family [Polyangiaceae bacterium]